MRDAQRVVPERGWVGGRTAACFTLVRERDLTVGLLLLSVTLDIGLLRGRRRKSSQIKSSQDKSSRIESFKH